MGFASGLKETVLSHFVKYNMKFYSDLLARGGAALAFTHLLFRGTVGLV